MSFGKTIPLYCITFLVLWLGGGVRLTESLEVIRGYNDKFPNSHSNCKSVSSGKHGSACSNFCSDMGGKCENPNDCTYCVCGAEGKNTYMRQNLNPTGRCVTDEKIVPESVPRDRFMIQNNNHLSCAVLDTSTSRVRGATCPQPFVENVRMLWKWTIGNQLMNIKTLKCIQTPNTGGQIIMKPCNLTSKKQTLSCQNCIGYPPVDCALRIHNNLYLKLPGRGNNMVSKEGDNQPWTSYPNRSMPVCSTPTKYDGCYRFSDGSFLRFLNLSACQDDKHCLTQEISAPIFKHNINCEIKWEESEYIQNEDSWKPVHGRKQFLSLVVKGNKRGIQLDVRKISNHDVLGEWNGSLLKLQIKCSNERVNDDKKPSEQHCVLLKFATLPDPQDESTTLVPPVTTQKPSIFPTITINPTSSEQWYFTDVKTNPTFSEWWYFTDVKTRALSSPILPGSKSGDNGGSSSSKAVAISVSIVALVLILLLVFGFMVFYRRRKRMHERANSEEMISRGEQNPQQVVYEEPSQMHEPLKDERGETSGEHYYTALKATNPPGDTPQGPTNDVYTYIDGDQGTAKPASTEYSYARSDAMPRSFGTQLPTPAPLASTPVYQTLEGPETEDNPSVSQNGMPNKAPSVANNPLDQQPANPVYQTLEEPNNAQKSDPTRVHPPDALNNPISKNSEVTDDEVPSSPNTPLHPQPKYPVYHTLEGPDIVGNPTSVNNKNGANNKVSSSADEALDQQTNPPVYQTLEDTS